MNPRPVAVRSPGRRLRGAGLVRVVVASAGVLLLAAGALWGFNRDGGGSASMREAAALDLARVQLGSFVITTTAMGELEAKNQIELRSELDTRAGIVEIVPEGTVVRKGDVLVRLNAEELQDQIDEQMLEVERAQADVIAAQAALTIQLSENESNRRAGELKVELAKLALAQWRDGEVVKMRKEHQLEIEQAERDLARLKERFERSETLLAEGFLSKDERDQDEIAYIDAVARVETAKLDQRTYEEYQHPRDEKTKLSDLEEAKADLDRILEQNDINATAMRSELETTKRQLALKEERLAKMQSQYDLATITAPTDGLVVYATSLDRDRGFMDSEGPLQVGREVRPNELLIILPDTSAMVAEVRVHESLAGRIRRGQRALVKVDALSNETFLGDVHSIGVLAETGGWRDPNRREYSVRIALDYDNLGGALKPSMRAEATITLGEVRDALMVPVQAVFAEGPVRYVLTPRGSRFHRVPVQIGRMSDAYAEIISGVSADERVLLREPDTGEVLNTAWTASELEAVGLAIDENGKPYKPGARRMPGMGGPDGLAADGGEAAGSEGRPEGFEGARRDRAEAGERRGRPGEGEAATAELAREDRGADGGAMGEVGDAGEASEAGADTVVVTPTAAPAEAEAPPADAQKAPAKD